MKCFELLRTVLDEVWDQLPGRTDDEKTTAVRAKEEYLHSVYAGLNNPSLPAVDYRDPATRYVYLCCYVASHANLVARRLELSRPLNSLFDREKLSITCVGGGPGSDLLGVLKYVTSQELAPQLNFTLFDKEQAWAESWSDVHDKIGMNNISTYAQVFDVTDPRSYEFNAKYLKSDLFTMIYFASEVHRIQDRAAPFFQHLFDRAKSGAMFLYIDNASPVFFNWFDAQWRGRGVEVIGTSDSEATVIPGDEQKLDLGVHYTDRINGHPKLRARTADRILRKT